MNDKHELFNKKKRLEPKTKIHQKYVDLPTVPFQNALGPSSIIIFRTASKTPVYVVCPDLATTCNLVLITSAGVTNEAAGIPAIAPAARSVSG